MSVVSSLALTIPILLIFLLRLGTYRSFPALLVYYSSSLVYILLSENYIHASPAFVRGWGLTNNLMDIPLILFFMTYFSTSKVFSQRMNGVITAYLIFEIIVLFIVGFNVSTITITLGPGLAIVFCLSLYFFIRQAKMAIEHRKATGKALMTAAVLFAYGCYSFIYLMYYVFKAHLDRFGQVRPQYKNDTFLIFFFATTLSSILMSIGLLIERKRIRKLNELKVTRKELSSIYPETKTAAPYRTAMLDFDKEQWN